MLRYSKAPEHPSSPKIPPASNNAANKASWNFHNRQRVPYIIYSASIAGFLLLWLQNSAPSNGLRSTTDAANSAPSNDLRSTTDAASSTGSRHSTADGIAHSLASTAYPLANPKPGHSLLGDRGVVAGTCTDAGYDYVFSYAQDARTIEWDKAAAKSHRTPGVATSLCGYGYDNYFEGARGNDPVMLDIGANMGLSLMPYLSKGWRIIAFEPVPDNVRTIRRNIFINGIGEDRIALVQGAVTDQSGALEIYAPKGRTDNASISKKGSTLNVGGEADAIKVTAVQVDRYINNAVSSELRNNIMLVKIDTQGHELSVLRGMKNFLSNPPSKEDLRGWSFVVIAEYDPRLQRAAGHDPSEMLDFMRNLGYEVRCKMTDVEPILPPASPKCPDVIFSKGKPTKPNLRK